MNNKYQRKYHIKMREKRFKEFIDLLIRKICFDFSDDDKGYLKEELYNKLSVYDMRRKGLALKQVILGSMYLISKCPANADKPLSLKEVSERGNMSIRSLRKGVRKLREDNVFPMVCRISYRQIILAKKDIIHESILKFHKEVFKDENEFWIKQNKLLNTINELLDRAIKVCNDQEFRFLVMGRNPYVISQALVYCVLLNKEYTTLTHTELEKIFGCSSQATRNVIRIIDRDYKHKELLIDNWDFYAYKHFR